MSLLGKFTSRSNLDPVKKLAEDAVTSLSYKFENSVDDLFATALAKTGLSSSVSNQLSSRFADAIKNQLADKYFQTSSSEISRLSKEDICDNFLPNYIQTASSEVRKIEQDLKTTGGVDSGNIIQYPPNLGKYYMSMKFRKYVRQAPQVQTTYKFDNAIILPVPKKLEEEFGLQINSQSMGMIGSFADVIQTTSTQPKDSYSPPDAILFSLAVNGADALASGASQYGGANLSAAITSYLGAIPNPHMAALFQGVDLRKFRFEWTFAPRNPDESITIQKLVERLKQNALPPFSSVGTAALQYPMMCWLELEPWYSSKEELIKFKPALLESVSINYSPNGIPSFFAGTTLPTFIQIQLNFMETTYFTSNDYGSSAATETDPSAEKIKGLLNEGNEWVKGATGIDISKGGDVIGNLLNGVDNVLTGNG